jgi:RNA polymerase sigma-70 factor (ECF subfamily)
MNEALAEDNRHDAPPPDIDNMFREHAPRVRGLCRHILGSLDAAEDAVSEVYLKASRSRDLYDPGQPFGRWLMTVARHYCFDVLRRRQREARLFTPSENGVADAAADAGHGPLTRLLEREARQSVRAAIDRLPPRYRLPLVLRYYEELSYDEIARELSVTRQDVATLLFRAKQKLRVALAPSTPTEDV